MRAATRNMIRKIWYGSWIFVASFLIMLALVFSVIRLLLPLATDYKNDIRDHVSRLLGHPAQIASIDTDWHWFKPRLKLIGVRLHDAASGSELFAAQEIILAVNPLSSAVNRRIEIDELTVVRTDFSLYRNEAGQIYAQGFALPVKMERNTAGAGLSVPDFLLGRTLRVIDSVVTFADDRSGIDYRLEAVNLTVRSGRQEHRVYLSVGLPEEIGERFEAGAELHGELQDLQNLRGRVYVRVAALELPAVLQKTPYHAGVKSGRLDFALWAELDSDARRRMQGNISLRDFAGDFTGLPLLSGLKLPFDRVSGDFQARLGGSELELELENLLLARGEDAAPVNGLSLKTSIDEASLFRRGEVMVDHLRLQDVWPVAIQYTHAQQALDKAGIEGIGGNVLRFYARWDLTQGKRDVALISRFEELGISARGKIPSVSALRGTVRLRNDMAVVDLETAGSQFDYPHLFRSTLRLQSLDGLIFARHSDTGLILAVRDLFLQTPHILSRHWFDLSITPGHAPYLNAYSILKDGDIKAAGEYLPVGIMSKKLVTWLDAAVVSGRLVAGDVELKGPLDKFPFRGNEGIFRGDADFDGMELNYFKDWAHLKNARLHTRFHGVTLGIAVHEGQISDTDIVGADALITDFRKSWLVVQMPLYGPLAGIANYLRTSGGLREHFDPLIDQLEVSGMQAGFVRLDIPLHKGPTTQWSFTTSIFDAALTFPGAGLKFADINSDIRFDYESIHAAPFVTSLNGHPLNVDIATYAEKGGNTARIALAGQVIPAGFLPGTGFNPAEYLKGAAGLAAAIDLPLTRIGDTERHPAIGLRLDVTGTVVELPAPFAKGAGTPATLSVDTEFMGHTVLADLDYNGWLDGKLRFQSGELERGDIRLFEGKSRLPATAGVFITGQVDELNIDHWLALRSAGTGGAANPLQRVELKAGRLTYLQRTLNDAVLQLTQQPQHWVAAVGSEFLTGSVTIPKKGASSPDLVFNLEYFNFDRLFRESPLTDKQLDVKSLTPADIPPFTLRGEMIVLNGWNLRQVELESDIDAGAQTLYSSLKIADPDVGLQGTAEWAVDKTGAHRTEISLNFDSKNVGKGLGKFGYAEIIREGTGTAKFDLAWPGPPHKFDLQSIQGEAQISLKEGQVLEIEPGGGRLFGLLSVQTIPRRLSFDFKDLFNAGFRFDKMKGRFEFSEGNAYTDNYYIDGPVGRIDIQGRVGMVQHDYDQKILFRPDLSSSLPLVGTLLGGTGTGLALIMVDRIARLFGKQTDDLARLEYTLTGSWDDPVMTPVRKQATINKTKTSNSQE